jgi:hypothetical protein
LKVIHDLYSKCLAQILSKTSSFTKPEGVMEKNQVDQVGKFDTQEKFKFSKVMDTIRVSWAKTDE